MKLYTILSGILSGCLLGFAGMDAARADTPQLAIGRMTAAYNSRDLTNYMAVHTTNFSVTNVSGKRQQYLPLQATIARQFASQTHTTLQCQLSSLALHGNTAQGRITEHYVQQINRAPKYTAIRDIAADVFWIKGPRGWQMTSEQMVRDMNTYQRL